MPSLVTGATGFIGRRLLARLRHEGEAVRALVLPNEDAAALGEGVEVVRGDITDAAAVAAAARGCERVYHLAAVVGDWAPVELFERVNVGGTRNVLEAAAAAGSERVVMVSSIAVYGDQLRTRPCTEDAPAQPGVGPYSRTKRESEELALDYHARGRVSVSVVRPGNVYGPQSGLWVDQLVSYLRAGQAVLIDGGQGDAVLAYVDNVIEVIARSGRAPEAAGRVYNANDGGGVTWRQYMTDLAGLVGAAPPKRSLPRQVAWGAALAMEWSWRALRRSGRPLVTREAVTLLASRHPAPIDRAARELAFEPIPYRQAMEQVAAYLHEGVA